MNNCFRLLVLLFFLLATQAGFAQDDAWPGRPRYPEGMLALNGGAGLSKYLGEFVDKNVGTAFYASGMYNVFPELGVGLHFMFGRLLYERRDRKNFGSVYQYQFGDGPSTLTTTDYSTLTIRLAVNFFPRQVFNAYFVTGGGVTLFTPEDLVSGSLKVRPKADQNAAFTLPAGLGAEYYFRRNLSLNIELAANVTFTDDLDAFSSDKIRTLVSDQAAVTTEGNDLYVTLTIGLRWHVFEDNDLDNDRLSNSEERELGTNPYDFDTDGDRLEDYDEVNVYKTNPLLVDSDADGITDYKELFTYRINPMATDSDGDGITDPEEIFTYQTNPMEADTDNDGLIDGEELEIGTNPVNADSDHDGLPDGDEIDVYGTDPRQADTDGDGLKDREELERGSDPVSVDTDGDGLNDYEECMRYRTDVTKPDTDGDGITDGREVHSTGTDPLRKDTDGDGIPDNLDMCPTRPEDYNGITDDDGCPDGAELSQPSRLRMTTRIDTVILREGSIFTLFGVNFETDKWIIRPESIPILEENAKLFKRYPRMIVEIRGHTDSVGSDEYNLLLSQRRAEAVRQWLISYGVDSSRISASGYGETDPVADNATELGRARNRRIEFYIGKLNEQEKENGQSIDSTGTPVPNIKRSEERLEEKQQAPPHGE
ncbi:MAG: OmpA family protein [Chlorobi bacterium]|nr:OmpA family protein [Chlorobiota bacterium]